MFSYQGRCSSIIRDEQSSLQIISFGDSNLGGGGGGEGRSEVERKRPGIASI